LTQTQRRRSFKTILLVSLGGLTFLLLFSSAFFQPASQAAAVPAAAFFSHLGWMLIFAAFSGIGPLWGLATTAYWCLLVELVGLSWRNPFLMILPLETALLAWVIHRGTQRWEGILREDQTRVGRIQEELNALEEQNRHFLEIGGAGRERLKRYQGLRWLANRLSLVLPMEELVETLSAAAGDLIQAADRVLLYLVDEWGLHLELQKVWRRGGLEPIKAKQGDTFDLWVMKHGQALLVEEVGRDFRFPETAGANLGRPLGAVLGVPLATEHRVLGVLRLESERKKGLTLEDLRLAGIVGDLAALAVENSTLYSQMAHLAMTDDLTGLLVKTHFLKRLEEAVGTARQRGEPVTVLLIDIDHFKGYNDRFGHSAGDKLLRQLGRLLTGAMRPGETAARFGGEEFSCVLPGVPPERGFHRAEEIRIKMEAAPVALRRAMTRATLSAGVASFPRDGLDLDAVLKAADRRLYRSKQMGRNRVCADDEGKA
jgi:diguanylate cyclase (GGDEF)-like protein